MKTISRATCSSLEVLEARIAPASVLTYIDIDGDKVTIKSSKGDLSGHATFSGGDNGQLQLLDLSDPSFAGANITFKVVKAGGGDGLAAVGRIDGGSNDLGRIVIKGDLGDIDAGSGTAGKAAIKSLTVRTMGLYGLATQEGAGDLVSSISGTLGSLNVAGDLKGVFIDVSDGGRATIGTVKIGGSLIGGASASSGLIYADGGIGAVKIAGDVIGGSGSQSGGISSDVKLGNVTIGGSVLGGNGSTSALIAAVGDVGLVKIGGDVKGGEGIQSGVIRSEVGGIKGVNIGGSVMGGDGGASGGISSRLNMGTVKIGGNLQGGSGTSSGYLASSEGTISLLKISGSLMGGSGLDAGQIDAGEGIRTLQITRDVRGGEGGSSGTVAVPGEIGRFTIGGSVLGGSAIGSGSIILTGGRIGTLQIGHDLQGGSASSTGSIWGSSGQLDNVIIGGSVIGGAGSSSGSIRVPNTDIGKLVIGGDLRGSSISGSDAGMEGTAHIWGQRIGSVVIRGSVIAGTDDSAAGGMGPNASISASTSIGSITVLGDVLGSIGVGGEITRPTFSVTGQTSPGDAGELTIGKITIGGNVERARILAGYSFSVPVNGDAQIGPVSVRGDWIASDLVAGVQDGGTPGFGDAGDTVIAGGTGIAKIASIQIGGAVLGTVAGGDQFGFVSDTIEKLRIGGQLIVLPPGLGGVSLSPLTGSDVTVRQV